jgi:hypothetical protein
VHKLQGTNPEIKRSLNGYALKLLRDLHISGVPGSATEGEHPARLLAKSGLMTLSASDTPILCPIPLADCANGALNAFRVLSEIDVLPGVAGAQLLTERAAITGIWGDGNWKNHCRLLPTIDGVIGLNLARMEDWELLPAWLESQDLSNWSGIAAVVLNKPADALIERGRLLGLAVADATTIPTGATTWLTASPAARPASVRRKAPRVIDLSSLWAGPLCAQLWQAAGAEVLKIESSQRPDGARSGSREFFNLLNSGKNCITLDLHRQSGLQALRDLIKESDIVLEASRPRALRQMGIVAEDLIEEIPGLTWVSITGYGRSEPYGNWVAYGDDAGISAGLSAILHCVTDRWLVYGDAIADPLTGLHAALAGWASWSQGGGQLLELSLEQTVRHCILTTAPPGNDYRSRQQRWKEYLENHNINPSQPKRRSEATSSA